MADTPGCVSRAEWDNLHQGLSLDQCQHRFDVGGHYEQAGPSNFAWSFQTCWATGVKRVWCWFSNVDGLLRRWEVRLIADGTILEWGGDPL